MEPRAYVFGKFRIDVAGRQLLREGEHVPLPAKSFDTLLLLVRHRDRVVGKDELMQTVWPDTFVSDDSLTQCISSLRRALGDAEVIATIPRRGYRFIMPVTEAGEEAKAEEPTATAPIPTRTEPTTAAAPVSRRRPRSRLAAAAAALLVVIAAAAWVIATRRAPADALPLRFTQEAPAGTAILSGGSLSPDGRTLAFIAEDVPAGTTKLWVRPLASATARALEGTESALRPFWSPDSQSLGFIANGRLKTVSLSGGTPRNLALVRNNHAAGAAWGDDIILFANWRAGLDAVAPTGGDVRAMTTLSDKDQDGSHQWPQFLPDNRHFLYVVASPKPERAGIYIGSIDGTTPVRILDGSYTAPTYAPPGYLLYVRDNTLMAQPFDADRRELTGEPITIADGVPPPTVRNSAIVSAAQGGLVAFGGGTTPRRLAWFDRRGTRLATIDAPGTMTNPSLSPDEKQLLAVSFDSDLRGVWMLDLERGAPNRLVPDASLPMSSPDGAMVAFGSSRGAGVNDLYVRHLGGRSEDELLLQTNESKFINDWSRDGRFILYTSSNAKTGEDVWVLPTFGDRKPFSYLRTQYNETQSRVSPDGKWVAYASDESGMLEVYLQSFPVPGAKQVISIRGGGEPVWRRDGRELYYLAVDRTLMAVDMDDSSGSMRVSRPRALFRPPVSGPLNVYRSHYAVAADGQRFIIDAVDAASTQESITVLANWTALLARPN